MTQEENWNKNFRDLRVRILLSSFEGVLTASATMACATRFNALKRLYNQSDADVQVLALVDMGEDWEQVCKDKVGELRQHEYNYN